MSDLDPLFASHPIHGFPDIWFLGLTPLEAADLFNFACRTFGGADAPVCAPCSSSRGQEQGSVLPDLDHAFNPLLFAGARLDSVAIRIEDDRLAVDFGGGLDVWSVARQSAFIAWLRVLHDRAPATRLAWAHEGCVNRPSDVESDLLRRAVAGVVAADRPR